MAPSGALQYETSNLVSNPRSLVIAGGNGLDLREDDAANLDYISNPARVSAYRSDHPGSSSAGKVTRGRRHVAAGRASTSPYARPATGRHAAGGPVAAAAATDRGGKKEEGIGNENGGESGRGGRKGWFGGIGSTIRSLVSWTWGGSSGEGGETGSDGGRRGGEREQDQRGPEREGHKDEMPGESNRSVLPVIPEERRDRDAEMQKRDQEDEQAEVTERREEGGQGGRAEAGSGGLEGGIAKEVEGLLKGGKGLTLDEYLRLTALLKAQVVDGEKDKWQEQAIDPPVESQRTPSRRYLTPSRVSAQGEGGGQEIVLASPTDVFEEFHTPEEKGGLSPIDVSRAFMGQRAMPFSSSPAFSSPLRSLALLPNGALAGPASIQQRMSSNLANSVLPAGHELVLRRQTQESALQGALVPQFGIERERRVEDAWTPYSLSDFSKRQATSLKRKSTTSENDAWASVGPARRIRQRSQLAETPYSRPRPSSSMAPPKQLSSSLPKPQSEREGRRQEERGISKKEGKKEVVGGLGRTPGLGGIPAQSSETARKILETLDFMSSPVGKERGGRGGEGRVLLSSQMSDRAKRSMEGVEGMFSIGGRAGGVRVNGLGAGETKDGGVDKGKTKIDEGAQLKVQNSEREVVMAEEDSEKGNSLNTTAVKKAAKFGGGFRMSAVFDDEEKEDAQEPNLEARKENIVPAFPPPISVAAARATGLGSEPLGSASSGPGFSFARASSTTRGSPEAETPKLTSVPLDSVKKKSGTRDGGGTEAEGKERKEQYDGLFQFGNGEEAAGTLNFGAVPGASSVPSAADSEQKQKFEFKHPVAPIAFRALTAESASATSQPAVATSVQAGQSLFAFGAPPPSATTKAAALAPFGTGLSPPSSFATRDSAVSSKEGEGEAKPSAGAGGPSLFGQTSTVPMPASSPFPSTSQPKPSLSTLPLTTPSLSFSNSASPSSTLSLPPLPSSPPEDELPSKPPSVSAAFSSQPSSSPPALSRVVSGPMFGTTPLAPFGSAPSASVSSGGLFAFGATTPSPASSPQSLATSPPSDKKKRPADEVEPAAKRSFRAEAKEDSKTTLPATSVPTTSSSALFGTSLTPLSSSGFASGFSFGLKPPADSSPSPATSASSISAFGASSLLPSFTVGGSSSASSGTSLFGLKPPGQQASSDTSAVATAASSPIFGLSSQPLVFGASAPASASSTPSSSLSPAISSPFASSSPALALSPSSGFAFGAAASSAATPIASSSPSLFTFGAAAASSSASASTTSSSASTSAFMFGSVLASSTSSSSSPSSAPFTFGLSASSASASSPFAFGATMSSTPTFSFGAAPTAAASAPAFMFGAGAASTPATSASPPTPFGFSFSTAQSTSAPPTSAFTFGASTSAAPNAATSGGTPFAFGSQAPATPVFVSSGFGSAPLSAPAFGGMANGGATGGANGMDDNNMAMESNSPPGGASTALFGATPGFGGQPPPAQQFAFGAGATAAPSFVMGQQMGATTFGAPSPSPGFGLGTGVGGQAPVFSLGAGGGEKGGIAGRKVVRAKRPTSRKR